ncbi:hypothetical protein ACXZ66_02305 [Corynebacterium sp. S7]
MSDDDKQLTVAELLARAQKEQPEAERPRRRRRRSLEEGGISVAELTGSIPKVEKRPVEAKHSSVPLDTEAAKAEVEPKPEPAKPAEKSPQVDETNVIRKVETDVPAKPKVTAPSPSVEETGKLQPVKDEHLQHDFEADAKSKDSAQLEQLPEQDQEQDLEQTQAPAQDEDREGGINGFALIGLIIVGLVLGVLIFLGFEFLWQTLNKWLVAVLAVVVTAIMVGVVKAMRTERDGFSMGLAGVVGLLMTFGPALIVFL